MIRLKSSLIERMIAILLVAAVAITALPCNATVVWATETGTEGNPENQGEETPGAGTPEGGNTGDNDEEKVMDDTFKFREVDNVIADKTITFGEELILSATSSNQPDAVVTYTSGNEQVVTIDENGAVTTLATGEVTITATIPASENYKEAKAELQLTITTATQSNFGFPEENVTVTYGENENLYTENKVNTDVNGGTITYSITSQTKADGQNVTDLENEAVARIDSQTGDVTIYRVGTIIVQAEMVANGYETVTAQYTLAINKGNQTLIFADGEVDENGVRVVDRKYGQYGKNGELGTGYTNTATGAGTGKISYSLPEGVEGTGMVQSFNPETGEISFNDNAVGSVTVTATIEEDDYYYGTSADYTLEISYLESPETPYILNGVEKNDSGWYTSDVTLKVAEGYALSESNSLSAENEWKSEIPYTGNGTHENRTIYLRNIETGAITEAVSIPEVNIDKDAPTVYKIEYTEVPVETSEENITLFDNEKINVTIAARDEESGLASLGYAYISDGTVVEGNSQEEITTVPISDVTIDEEGRASYTFTVPAEFRGKIQAYATDVAGNECEPVTEETIVVDNKAPEVAITLYDANNNKLDGDAIQSNTAVTAHVTVKESNFRSAATKATVNGTEIAFDREDWARIEGKDEWTNTLTIEDNGELTLRVESTDLLDKKGETSVFFKLDSTPPDIEVECSNFLNCDDLETGKIYYFDEETTAIIKITDKHFNKDDVKIKVNNEEHVFDTEWSQQGDTWSNSIPISGEGVYTFSAEVMDSFGNRKEGELSTKIVIDNTVPTAKIELLNTDGSMAKGENPNYPTYFNKDTVVKVTVTDVNVDRDRTVLQVNNEKKQWDGEWKQGTTPEEWYNTVTLQEDAQYTVTATAMDRVNKKGNDNTAFTLDKTKITTDNMEISYSDPIPRGLARALSALTFGYYQSEVIVTLTAVDNVAGVDSFTWTYTRENGASETKNVATRTETITAISDSNEKTATATFTLSATEAEQFRGSVEFYVTDKTGTKSDVKADGTRVNVVDNIAPQRTVTYSPAYKVVDAATFEEKKNYEYDAEETNSILYYMGEFTATFTVTEANFYPEDVVIKVNDAVQDTTGWVQNGDVWTKSITLAEDGKYQITMDYLDRSNNQMKTYCSEQIVIDKADPVVQFELLDATGNAAVYKSNENYFNQNITAKITVTDESFYPGFTEIVINGEVAEDCTWQKATDMQNKWYCMLPFRQDGCYEITVTTEDFMDKKASKSVLFYVDKTAPGADRMEITYSDELDTWEKLVNAVTFGYYYAYAREVEVTLTAWDDGGGIDSFAWTYSKEEGASESNVPQQGALIPADQLTLLEGGKKAVATFKLTASEYEQYRGNISFVATDKAGNSSIKNDNEKIIVVDNISPTRMVTYTPAKQVVDASTYMPKAEYQYHAEHTNSILYYDGDVTATFQIAEANFDARDVVIQVNGNRVSITDWQRTGDIWTGTYTITGDGEYCVTMSYTDHSNNRMVEYISEKIVIDTVAPVILVTYGNQDVQNTIDDVKYYKDVQTATITIAERNFRADDVVATVTAKDIEGKDIVVDNYAEILSNRSNWVKDGDVYTTRITYSIDANYEFDIEYKDLAKNNAADYPAEKFTVDKSEPQNVNITYSESLLEEVLETITFGFYNAQMIVTLTAEDYISGVNEIEYSYTRAEGASEINAELLDATLSEAEIQRSGKVSTVEVRVPKTEVSAENQVNGIVKCEVSDRSKNVVDLEGEKRIVVDNIAPTINVTFSDPVREENEIAYYDGDIAVTMEINEANFYKEDVELRVTRDGADIAVSPEWMDESTDIHVGTFTLQEDGDYMITVDYTDKSSNTMEQYTSQQLTIDTEEPTISVSNIKANSASKEETFGFTITADDTNFDVSTFEPLLTAVVQSEAGSFTTKEIPLGSAHPVEAGKTYAFTVNNLEEDAIYTLTCTVTDMSNHTHTMFYLDDGTEHERVQFSINRNGSNFLLDRETEELVEQYYVYGMEDDVVVREINVDPVETYAVSLNGELLLEGTDYDTMVSGGDGQWSERDYIIRKELFAEEGEYHVSVESTDKTETVAYSDVKDAAVAFAVDKSAPIVTISGLENEGRYQVREQEVTVMPTDEGGRLNSFIAVVLDSEGNPIKDAAGVDISKRVELSGDALTTHLAENDGKVTFTVPEGLQSQVQIICTDCAVHSDGSTNEYNEIFSNITVSQSEWVMFYANKSLFYGIIAGVTVPVVGGISLVVWRRRKKR